MNASEIKQKLLMGQMSDEEFAGLLNKAHPKRDGGFLKTLLTGFQKGYTEPQMLKLVLESVLLLVIICGTVTLAYMNKIEVIVTAILLSIITGYLLGRTR